MEVIGTSIPDVKRIRRKRFADERGFFWEPFKQSAFAEAGLPDTFLQDNHSLSRQVGTVRGLHYQIAPQGQAKLIWVVSGAIFDVAVDIRKKSPTFGQHVSMTLKADEPEQILIPEGFAHGFCTLEPDTQVMYKVTRLYSPPHERGILWNDPALGIAWPVGAGKVHLSEKDKGYPTFKNQGDLF